jgi:hypothetical protein
MDDPAEWPAREVDYFLAKCGFTPRPRPPDDVMAGGLLRTTIQPQNGTRPTFIHAESVRGDHRPICLMSMHRGLTVGVRPFKFGKVVGLTDPPARWNWPGR